jgi:hypothetical protein
MRGRPGELDRRRPAAAGSAAGHDFKRRFTSLIAAEAARRPDCMAATYMNELGLPQRVAAAPFAE